MDDKIPPLVVFAEGLLYSFVGDYFTHYDVSQVLFSIEFVVFELIKRRETPWLLKEFFN
jgi:hypothetical protein